MRAIGAGVEMSRVRFGYLRAVSSAAALAAPCGTTLRTMRLNARTAAALLAIVVGLALVVFAALGSKGSLPGTLKPPPPIPVAKGTIPPLDTRTGVQPGKPGPKDPADVPGITADIFGTEYGERGVHKVTVTIKGNGPAGYSIKWRDGKSEQGTTAGLTRERTIKGGFPLTQVAVQGIGASVVTCTVEIDGAEKSTKTTERKFAIQFCTG